MAARSVRRADPTLIGGIDQTYNVCMKLTLQSQLLPDAPSARALKATVERFNEAANWLAALAFERKLSNKFALQRLAYQELRERFGLPADMAIRCISQVCEAYKRDKAKRPRFRKQAAVPFSMGKNISFKGPDRVSLSTLVGRVVVPFITGKYQAERFGWSKGQCDLVLRRDGKWFLLVTVDVPDGIEVPVTDFIGVDLGVENIATDSDGERKSSGPIEGKRIKYAKRRRDLGRACKDADRNQRRRCRKALKQTADKEARYRRDINHKIAKDLVAKAKDTGRGIGLEDLEGIRERLTVNRRQRDRFNGWAHAQLGAFIAYKAQLAGVPVEFIDPAYTSQTCSRCGHCERSNRKSQAEFQCRACGYEQHADVNAARNVRASAVRQAVHGDGKGPAGDAGLMPSTVAITSPRLQRSSRF
jgi:IS605 OrfB family transposase